MNRRQFLTYTSGAAVGTALSRVDHAFAQDAVPAGWRTFEVTTRVEVLKPSGSTRVWLPAALLGETPFQKTLANEFKAEGGNPKLVEGKADALGIVVAEFPAGPAATRRRVWRQHGASHAARYNAALRLLAGFRRAALRLDSGGARDS